jgi:hypothetical protein
MIREQTLWQHNERSRKEFLLETLQFDYTNLYILISWSSELNLSALRFTDENCSSWKSTWWFWRRFCRRSLLKRRIRYSKAILICFEFRTLFRFKNKKNLYLNEKQKIKSRMRNIITFMLERIKSRMRDTAISLKEIELRNVEMLLYFLKNQLLTKVDFKKCLQSSS